MGTKGSFMPNQTIEDLLPNAEGSVYKLVRMASKRAMELADGKPSLIEKPQSDKETSIALEEIARGRVMSRAGVEKAGKKKDS